MAHPTTKHSNQSPSNAQLKTALLQSAVEIARDPHMDAQHPSSATTRCWTISSPQLESPSSEATGSR